MEEDKFINLFKTELTDLNNRAKNKEEFFDNAYSQLFKKGYVKESFKEAITEREDKYPTGLALENINIAIPHTDTEHIERPFVYVNRLNNKLKFNQMGNEDEMVQVEDIWVLGIKDGNKQVNLLAFIMDIFNNLEFIDQYHKVKSAEELLDLLKKI